MRASRFAAVALLVALGLASRPAAAVTVGLPWTEDSLRIDILNSLFFDSHWDNDDGKKENDDYFDIRDKFNLDLSLGDYTLGGRFDLAIFPDPPESAYQNDYRLEKVYLRIHKQTVSITLGDFYASFGRGIALYFRKTDELSFDPSLKGAFVDWFDDYFRITVLAGLVNDINVDDRVEKKLDDPNDLVLGARVEGTIPDLLTLGLHGVMMVNRKDFPPTNDYAPQDRLVVGATVDAPDLAGIVSFYGEFDTLWRTDVQYDAAGPVEPTYNAFEGRGWAGYATATASFLDFTVLTEFRYSDDWLLGPTLSGDRISRELSYVRPPTLDRVRERFIDNLSGSWGVRGRIDYTFPTRTILYVNVLHLWDEPQEEGRTLHVYGGVAQRFDDIGFLADVSGGYRWQQEQAIGGGGLTDFRRMWHVDAAVETVVWGPHSVQIEYHHEEYEDFILGGKTFHIGELVATYSFAPWFDAAFLWGYTTEDAGTPTDYYGGDLRFRITSDSFLRVFVGSRKGGFVCVNGVCRQEPPFEGVRTELVARF